MDPGARLDADRPSRAERVQPFRPGRRGGGEDGGRAAPAARVRVGPGRPAGGDHPVAEAAQHPGTHKGHPRDGEAEAGLDEREIGEDVPGEHLVEQDQVVERGRPGAAPGDPPVLDPHVVQHLALRRLGPAHRPAVCHRTVRAQPGGPGRRIPPGQLTHVGQFLRRPPEQAHRPGHLVPPDLEPVHGITPVMTQPLRQAQCGVTVVRAGAAVVVVVARRPADRAERAMLAGPLRPQRPGAPQPVQER